MRNHFLWVNETPPVNLKTETILSISRIAIRLHLGSAKRAKAKLAAWKNAHTRPSLHLSGGNREN